MESSQQQGSWGLLLVGLLVLTNWAWAYPLNSLHSQPNIDVSQNDAWVDFPEAIDFHLLASASTPIVAAELEYGVQALTCGQVATVVVPDFEPGPQLDLDWRWQVSPGQIIPPGGRVWWRWNLETEDGQQITTPVQELEFKDDWFVWESLEEGSLTVHWYRGTRTMAQDMLASGREALVQLAADTGLELTDPVSIYLYEEPFDLRLSIPGAPSWIGGIAFPEHNIVLVVANESYLDYGRQTVRHELGHLVIGRLTFNCLASLPTWLNEGLAMVAEGEEDAQLAEILNEAIDQGQALTWSQLEGSFSVHSDRASLSYAQSYSIVRFMIDQYGQERLLALLDAHQRGILFDQAVQDTYDLSMHDLENAWRDSIGVPRIEGGERPTPTPVPTLALLVQPVATVTEAINPSPVPATLTPWPNATSTRPASPTPTPQLTPVPTPVVEPVQTEDASINWLQAAGAGAIVLFLIAIIVYLQFQSRRA